MIDDKTVQKVARLAHLRISDEALPALRKEFGRIIEGFQILQGVNTDGVEAMISPVTEATEFREDCVSNPATVEEILANAPERKGALFKVPPVV